MGRLAQASCASMRVNKGSINTEPIIDEEHKIKKQEYKSIQTRKILGEPRDTNSG